MNRFAAACAALLLGSHMCAAQTGSPTTRRELNLNRGWRYLEADARDIAALDSDPNEWPTVDLPHTWNRFDALDQTPGYRRAASWYRKDIEAGDVARVRYILHFEGANITTDVYVNGRRAGGHVGGYIGFDVDLTPLLRANSLNRLDVRVDNSYNPHIIPSQKSDFVIYGGITRDVLLRIVPMAHIARVRMATPLVSHAMGRAVVNVDVAGNAPGSTLFAFLSAPDGRVVARRTRKLAAGAGLYQLRMPDVRAPTLWSPGTPALYTVTVQLQQAGHTIDEQRARFGFRWFEFRAGGAFYLNGERLLLRGTHWHEDYAGYGAALPDSLRRHDMRMIKEMGANYVRLAHYPHDPAVYDAADELGLILWDELPWCRGGSGDAEWQANTKRLLREQIEQNQNHPSILLWSLGNEVDWLPDFGGGDDPKRIDAFITELNAEAHRLDPTRVTALRKYPGAAPIVDVFSPSIWAGWYSGVYSDYQKALENAHKQYPRFVHMEYGGDSHVGRHTEQPITGQGLATSDGWTEAPTQVAVRNIAQNGDWSESYIVDLMEWHIMVAAKLPWFTGNAQWAFKDFTTPLRPENPIPYVNQKGLLDRAGTPKDAYYVYKSHWTTQPKFTYIMSHIWTDRRGPATRPLEVRVYSNCDSVELSLNGTSQGARRRVADDFPAQGLRWNVHFAAGENRLSSHCRSGPATSSDSLTVHYSATASGPADHITMSTEQLPNGHLLIVATAVDAQGKRALDYNRRIYFAHDGAGELVVDYGTPTRSRIIEMANGRAAIEFVPGAGRAVIEARNQDFKGAYLELK